MGSPFPTRAAGSTRRPACHTQVSKLGLHPWGSRPLSAAEPMVKCMNQATLPSFSEKAQNTNTWCFPSSVPRGRSQGRTTRRGQHPGAVARWSQGGSVTDSETRGWHDATRNTGCGPIAPLWVTPEPRCSRVLLSAWRRATTGSSGRVCAKGKAATH